MKRIEIQSVERIIDNNGIKIQYTISVFDGTAVGHTSKLWYQFSNEYESFITEELCDSVVVSILNTAVKEQYNIVSDLPISESLYFRLTTQLIPKVAKSFAVEEISIRAPLSAIQYSPYAVATGISCGVDSFTTLYEYTDACKIDDYCLTHLTYFQNGAHHSGHVGHGSLAEELFDNQLKDISEFCKKYGFPLIVVRSNIDECMYTLFKEDDFQKVHTYRNAGFVLLLQKLVRTYYYSSAGFSDIKISTEDSAHYDAILLPNVSTDSTVFYSSNKMLTRLEKTKLISQYEPSYDNLLVCYRSGKNCCTCLKCVRTMITLDFLGVLDKYSNSFDVDYYRKHRGWYLSKLCMQRKYSFLMEELYQYAISQGIHIPFSCRIKGDFLRFARWMYVHLFEPCHISFTDTLATRFIEQGKK